MILTDYSKYPRLVKALDVWCNAEQHAFQLGTRMYEVIKSLREISGTLTTSGGIFTLVNDLRGRMVQVITLDTELRSRLHTAGDYQVLISALRGLFISGGSLQSRFQDLEDKAYEIITCNPGWQQDTIAPTSFQNANPIYAVVDGVETAVTLSTLAGELRTRLHTAGDYQVLLSALRAELVAGGQIADRIIDLEDKAYNGLLSDPGWREDPGVNTSFQNQFAILAVVNGGHIGGEYFAIGNEMRTRLHTGGDYQVLISALRGEFITGGQIQARLQDLEDKAYNQILVNPGWAEAAAPTSFENVNQIDGILNGVYTAAMVAAGVDVAPTSPAWDTGAGQTRLVTLSSPGATITATIGAIDDVIPPRPPSGECPIGVVHIPANFTGGVTQIAAGGVTFDQGFPRRLAVHTPIATANVAALTNGAMAALIAAETTVAPDASWDTNATPGTRIITLSVNGAGVLTQTASLLDAVVAPRPPSGNCPVGWVEVATGFNPGVSDISTFCTFHDEFPRRLAVHTPIATANVAAITAAAPTAPRIAAATAAVPSAGWDTFATPGTRLVTLSVNAAGVLTQTPSALGATVAPRPPSGECPVGVAHVPTGFNPGVTEIIAGGVTFDQGFPRRQAVHTPLATADVAVIAAAAPTAVSAAAATALAVSTPTDFPAGDF